MAAIVSLRDVIDEMEIMSDEATSYINRKTGELITLTDEISAMAEDPDDAEEVAEWQKEILPKAREVAVSEVPVLNDGPIRDASLLQQGERGSVGRRHEAGDAVLTRRDV